MTVSSYLGLPALAGLCSIEQAKKEGISVEECVRRLKRFHFAFKRLHQIFAWRITAEPIYELKMAFSYHSYLCSEHVSALSARVAEMREPPLGLDQVPDPNLEIFYDEILAAPGSAALLKGLYAKAVPALQKAMQDYIDSTNLLADSPSVRVCRFALIELGDMAEFGRRAITSMQAVDLEGASSAANLTSPKSHETQDSGAWLAFLDDLLCAAGGLDGAGVVKDTPLTRQFSKVPGGFDPVPRRDERFKDPYNMGVNAEAFLYDPQNPVTAKILMLYYKRLREIDVPEMMASILAGVEDKPWKFYHDLTRQLWDEARHAMMGEVGFLSLGLDWPELTRINFTWSLSLNTQLQPWERYSVLYFIEQGLMPRTGKRYEWEIAKQSGDRLAQLFQDFDWADEVLHAHNGQAWYVSAMPSREEALRFGDACWSKVFMNFNDWRDKGLTQHENWWPGLYQAACKKWGIEPDARALAFKETYESKRADLKEIDG
jgi:hypothetical protein